MLDWYHTTKYVHLIPQLTMTKSAPLELERMIDLQAEKEKLGRRRQTCRWPELLQLELHPLGQKWDPRALEEKERRFLLVRVGCKAVSQSVCQAKLSSCVYRGHNHAREGIMPDLHWEKKTMQAANNILFGVGRNSARKMDQLLLGAQKEIS